MLTEEHTPELLQINITYKTKFSKGSKFTLDGDLVEENFTFIQYIHSFVTVS
jgi:hypothetical protein